MHISIVGAGYVGLVTAACLAHVGHDVICLDVDAARIEHLGEGVVIDDGLAGWLARRMGLPVEQLVIATNRNDVLHRVMTTSTYGRQPLAHTLSPSMDITVSPAPETSKTC